MEQFKLSSRKNYAFNKFQGQAVQGNRLHKHPWIPAGTIMIRQLSTKRKRNRLSQLGWISSKVHVERLKLAALWWEGWSMREVTSAGLTALNTGIFSLPNVSKCRRTSSDIITVFYVRLCGRFVDVMHNHKREKFYRTNQFASFLKGYLGYKTIFYKVALDL